MYIYVLFSVASPYPTSVCILFWFHPMSTISSRSTCATPHRRKTIIYTFKGFFFQGLFIGFFNVLYRINLGFFCLFFDCFFNGVCKT